MSVFGKKTRITGFLRSSSSCEYSNPFQHVDTSKRLNHVARTKPFSIDEAVATSSLSSYKKYSDSQRASPLKEKQISACKTERSLLSEDLSTPDKKLHRSITSMFGTAAGKQIGRPKGSAKLNKTSTPNKRLIRHQRAGSDTVTMNRKMGAKILKHEVIKEIEKKRKQRQVEVSASFKKSLKVHLEVHTLTPQNAKLTRGTLRLTENEDNLFETKQNNITRVKSKELKHLPRVPSNEEPLLEGLVNQLKKYEETPYSPSQKKENKKSNKLEILIEGPAHQTLNQVDIMEAERGKKKQGLSSLTESGKKFDVVREFQGVDKQWKKSREKKKKSSSKLEESKRQGDMIQVSKLRKSRKNLNKSNQKSEKNFSDYLDQSDQREQRMVSNELIMSSIQQNQAKQIEDQQEHVIVDSRVDFRQFKDLDENRPLFLEEEEVIEQATEENQDDSDDEDHQAFFRNQDNWEELKHEDIRYNSQESSEEEEPHQVEDSYHPVTTRIEKKCDTPISNTEWEIEDENPIASPASFLTTPQHKKSRNTKEEFFFEQEGNNNVTTQSTTNQSNGEKKTRHFHRRTHSKTFDPRFVSALLVSSNAFLDKEE